jgi:hypothetical protein
MRSTPPNAAPAAARPAAILSPVVDLLLVGGLSVVVFVPLLLSGRTDLVLVGAGVQAWLGALINMPHFMASYRIIYRSREMILKHRWASIYVPLILLAYAAIAVTQAETSPALVVIFIAVASAYLAWHYTGQVWGMMASYAYLDGARFEARERLLVRTSLRILLVWHLTWFAYTQLRDPSRVRPAYLLVSAGTVVAFALGAAGLLMMRRRTGKLPPARALVAWLAIFVWYAVMARDPKAIFWIQIAHALQYLAFPIRVEMNRVAGATRGHAVRWAGRHAARMAAYGVGLLAASLLIARVVPGQAMGIVGDVFGEEPGRVAPILLLMFINIHHYFTDGVIWKISNPEVRRDLFAHVQPPAGKAAAAPAGAPPAGAAPAGAASVGADRTPRGRRNAATR